MSACCFTFSAKEPASAIVREIYRVGAAESNRGLRKTCEWGRGVRGLLMRFIANLNGRARPGLGYHRAVGAPGDPRQVEGERFPRDEQRGSLAKPSMF